MSIPDEDFYASDFPIEGGYSLFSPWNGYGAFGERWRQSRTTFPRIRLYYIHQLLFQALACGEGEVWELGVWRGESAAFLGQSISHTGRKLRLFDTFQGMPDTDPNVDWHKKGDFSDTSLDLVKSRLAHTSCPDVDYMVGTVPETFAGLDNRKIVFAHVDLDIYWPIKASCEFIFPRLPIGGAMLLTITVGQHAPAPERPSTNTSHRGRNR